MNRRSTLKAMTAACLLPLTKPLAALCATKEPEPEHLEISVAMGDCVFTLKDMVWWWSATLAFDGKTLPLTQEPDIDGYQTFAAKGASIRAKIRFHVKYFREPEETRVTIDYASVMRLNSRSGDLDAIGGLKG